MNRVKVACFVLLTGGLGCAGVDSLGFGPFPTSIIAGGSVAGVASFIPGLNPEEGEFSLVVVNTDSTATYDVSITPNGSTTTTKQALPCNAANFIASCDAGTVAISATTTGLASPATMTLIPASNCAQQVVFITATETSAEGETPATKTVTLTQTIPDAAATCGLGMGS